MVVRQVAQRIRGRVSLPRSAIVLSLISFCVAVGFGVVVPVLPVFARSFGVDNFAVGAVISAFAVMRLATSPLCGPMVVRFSERAVLAVGIGIVAVSSALSGLAQSYVQLLVFRGAGGIGSAMFTVSAMTLLLGTVEPGQRGRAMGAYQGGFLIGGMAGPAIGGLLARISLTAPFFFYAATLAVAGMVGLALLPRSVGTTAAPAEPDPDAPPAPSFARVLRDPRYQAACLANFAQGWTSFGVRSALVPVLIVDLLGYGPTWIGTAFALAAVAQTVMLVPAGRVVDSIGRRPALIVGGLTCALAIGLIAYSPNLVVLTGCLMVYGAGAAFLGTAPAASVGDAAGPGRSGTPIAVFSMCSDAGAIIGPLLAGVLADAISYPAAFGIGAVLLLAGAIVAVRVPPGVPSGSAVAASGPAVPSSEEGEPS